MLLVGGGLPGALVRHGENPRDAALRGLVEAGGPGPRPAPGSRPRPVAAGSEVSGLTEPAGERVHTLRLVYEVRLARVDARAWPPEAELVPTSRFAAEPLMHYATNGFRAEWPESVATDSEQAGRAGGGEVPAVMQRPAAYAVLTDRPDHLLLTHLAGSGGLWTLPGGGIDFGEEPIQGLRREVHEETGLPYTPGPLLDVLSRHFTGRAPSGRLEDFHGISLLFGGSVPADLEPRVVEIGGSTDVAAWQPLPGLGGVRAVPSAHEAVRHWRRGLPPVTGR